MVSLLYIICILFAVILPFVELKLDKGYIAYCPCMGRFGNQADHFLGALGFAKGINRTLILPPWVEYKYGEPRSIQVHFNKYFKVDPLLEFHDVILMEDFMKDIAPEIWPPDKRIAFCYSSRGSIGGCSAKEGNPFGPFWDTFNLDFVDSEFYGPLHYDVYYSDMPEKWNQKYPIEKFPVLAFTGAPASFPVQKENTELHKYLKWSDNISREAKEFIKKSLPRGAFIGIHLRNGIDWVRACEHVEKSPLLFAAPQCVGYSGKQKATKEMCLPSEDIIIRQIKRHARSLGNIKSLVVASDSNHMLPVLSKALSRMEITVVKAVGSSPHVELAILGLSNYFIGNCISSFTAFVKRERDVRGLPSGFWSYPASMSSKHDEL